MSRENVEAFKRCADAFLRGDLDAALEDLDSEVEWRDALPMLLGGAATVYRGHAGVRDLQHELQEVIEFEVEFAEIRDLGDRTVATGLLRTRGRGSGIETETFYGMVCDWANGKATHIWTYVDADEAFDAAELST
ncbi:MAG: nuclear transport factor 2 family protein [Thermoleophilaceae bacterium]